MSAAGSTSGYIAGAVSFGLSVIKELASIATQAIQTVEFVVEKTVELTTVAGKIAIDVVKTIWNLPNTILGLAYGFTGVLLGGDWPVWDSRTNSLCFANSPLTFGNAVTMVNTVIAGPAWDSYSSAFSLDEMSWYQLLNHEGQHVIQGGVLGPAYFPAHVIDKALNGLIFNTEDRGFMGGRLESGPYDVSNPRPWWWK